MSNNTSHEPARSGCFTRVGLILISFPFILYFALAAVGLGLSFSDIPRKADALVLLSGGDSSRAEETVRLYEGGYSETVILTRTSGVSRGNHIYTLQDLVELGVPARAVLFAPGQSDSTFDEARHVLELMDAKNMGDALVVTDPYHAFRARMIFRGEFRESGKAVWVRAGHAHWYGPMTWMFTVEGWQVTLKEIIKIGAYFFGIKGS